MSPVNIVPFLQDIEPRNILLSKVGTPEMEVKLADFENVFESPNDFPIQPLAVRSPEVWLRLPWGPSADIWNLGLLFVRIRFQALLLDLRSPDIDEFRRKIMYLTKMKRLFGLNNPWPDAFLKSGRADDLGLVDSLVAQTKTPSLESFLASRNGSEVEIDFATRMLQIDPAKRWTAEQLLGHRWVTS
ncbi:CMGC protein kinase [Trichophyton interdigitale]|uniref:CMGC protein kinase n=1 Tax=Trichophyton interdigitale TaxID=101480 RepID=A0A9P5CXU6_9EURO|nr:CMGC protein kinase [Trichophyton interdigitale]KAF3900716.1 CMGC protein kinase [Trichophyton interdigitale]